MYSERLKVGTTNDAKTDKQSKMDRFDKQAEQEYIRDIVIIIKRVFIIVVDPHCLKPYKKNKSNC